jgi:DNA repair protein RadA/Sms
MIPPQTVALGEVSLGGQVRPVSAVARRLEEAYRIGMTTAIVPTGTTAKAPHCKVRLVEVTDLQGAMRTLRAAAPAVASAQ